jgi:hypothetical protein
MQQQEQKVLAKVYRILLEDGERDRYTIYDPDLRWWENREIIRKRYEEDGYLSLWSEELTFTERRMLGGIVNDEVMKAEREGKTRRDKNNRVRKNLEQHRFFWKRLKGMWEYLMPDERLHILRRLQDIERGNDTISEIKQIIENAQWFAIAEKQFDAEIEQNEMRITSDELDILLELEDDLWDELMTLYKARP